ncbi:MAG: penicillin-binding protein [Flavobacteriaceae bacterium]
MNKNKVYRFYGVAFAMLIFALVLFGKLLYIQLYQAEHYEAIAEGKTLKKTVIQPSRGNIYSDDGTLLATSVAEYELRWDAATVAPELFHNQRAELAQKLADFFQKSPQYFLNRLNKAWQQKNRYMLLAKNLTHTQYQTIKQFPIFRLGSYKGGLIVEREMIREHPLGKIAERTIGYEKMDPKGYFLRVGLEGAYGNYLRGAPGVRLKQRIANGQWKPLNDTNEVEPSAGYDLYSTINVPLQNKVHDALLAQLEKFEAEHGTAVVMEVATGEIKAIANLGRTDQGKYYERLNYAVGEAHEPGSTFKLMGMIAALEDGLIQPNDLIDTENGVLTFFGKFKVRDSRRGGYGKISASKIFEVSSNVGMVKIIDRHYSNNPRKFIDRLYAMGLKEPLGVSIHGEAAPKIPYPTDPDWDGLDLPWMAYGYGLTLTPLQTLTFYNAVANDGIMVKPRFVKRLEGWGKNKSFTLEAEVIKPSICSKETLTAVRQMMFNVVNKPWGTARSIQDDRISMAGKTGTCQVDYNTDNVQYISSFVGYFPAEQPIYSCIVVIHRPNKEKGYYGASVAAPVFKEIAVSVNRDFPKEIEVAPSAENKVKESLTPEFITDAIPDLKGMPFMDAVALLEQLGVQVNAVGRGKVLWQSVKAGTPIGAKMKIELKLG